MGLSPARSWVLSGLAALALAAAAAGPAAAASDWNTFGNDPGRSNANPRERILGVGNAPALRQAWAARLEGVVNAQPLYLAGVRTGPGRRTDLVIAATENGVLSAHDAATGARVWRRALGARSTGCADLPRGRYGISATPVAGTGTVYAVSGDGRMHAVAAATGRERRDWPVAVTRAPAREYVWGALALRAGRLYAATASHCSSAFYRGRITALDTRRARPAATWFPLGPRRRGGGMWGWGGVAIDRAGGDLFVATADAIGAPAHAPGADSVTRLTRDLRLRGRHRAPTADIADSEFGGAPLLLRAAGCPPQLAVMHKSGALFLYDRDRLERGPRQALQLGRRGFLGAYGNYAWSAAARLLFVANNSTGDFSHGLVALRVTSGCRLAPAWSQPVGPDPAILSPPAVANGVVYLATGFGREVHAFEAASGRPLWASGNLGGAIHGGPIVAGGRLFVAGWDARLRAFSPA